MLNKEGFTHVPSLDLNMRYYHIELSPGAKNICTIILPWGKSEYQKIPMDVCNTQNTFQVKISNLFKGFNMVYEYIGNLLNITKHNLVNHLRAIKKQL